MPDDAPTALPADLATDPTADPSAAPTAAGIGGPTPTPLPTRPVVPGFHPDPSVVRDGDGYVLVCSSFEYAPGLPVFRSDDLVTWDLVGHAWDRPSQLRLDGLRPSGGVYAPTLRHHDGRFWLVTTNVNDGPGHLLVTAERPEGPWSEPVRIAEAGGIDPDLAWDEDGTCYLTWCDGGIQQAVLDPTTGRLLSAPRRIWSGTGGKHPEGPHLHRVGDTWYLLVAEGGTGHGHAVSVARAPSPAGPFEPSPHNPLLTARGTESVVQNAGHADLVERPDGTWAVVFLGVRPVGYFPGWHVLGRETYAAEVTWRDGWPVLGAPVQPTAPAAEDETLPPHDLPVGWVGAGVFPADVLRWSGDAWRLAAPAGDAADEGATAADAPGRTFVGRRQEHTRVTVRGQVEPGDGTGGIEVRIDPDHALTLEVDGARVRAVARVGSLVSVLGEAAADATTVLELRADASPFHVYSHRRGPDELVAVVHGPDGTVELGRLDGRYLSSEVAAGFTGRMVGLVASRGEVVVRSFTYAGHDAEPEA